MLTRSEIPWRGGPPFPTPSIPQIGLYGISVMATEYPALLEVFAAVETGVGTGAYGTSATAGRVEAVSGKRTIWIGYAPIDGKRRQLKARHVKDGCTDSSFTPVVTVTPSVAQSLPWGQRAIPYDDGDYPLRATNNTGLAAHGSVTESGGKAVNRLFAKALSSDSDNLDFAPDGSTYKRVLGVASNLITPSSVTGRNRCRLSNSAAQVIGNDTLTALTWDTEDYDTGSLHDPTVNPSRITIPAGGDTRPWFFFGYIPWAFNATGDRGVYIAKNGVIVSGTAVKACAGLFGGLGVSTELPVAWQEDAPAVGDYWEVLVRQNSGGNLNVGSNAKFGVTHQW